MSHQQNCHDYECDQRNYNEKSVVALERSKRRAGIWDVNQMKKLRDYIASFVWTDRSQDQLLSELIQRVERKSEKEDEPHYRSREVVEWQMTNDEARMMKALLAVTSTFVIRSSFVIRVSSFR